MALTTQTLDLLANDAIALPPDIQDQVERTLQDAAATTTSAPSTTTFTLASRASALATCQTEHVRRLLHERQPGLDLPVTHMAVTGERYMDIPLYRIGGKALWTKELEVALLEGAVDALVHSLKDVPTSLPKGCQLAAILPREAPDDAFVLKQSLQDSHNGTAGYSTIDALPPGSVIGTSSVRRTAQLRAAYPHLAFHDVRGNIGTRLAKLDDPASPYTALVLAKAGLVRLGLEHRITSLVEGAAGLYAVGQGALAVEIRQGDKRAEELVGAMAGQTARTTLSSEIAEREEDASETASRAATTEGAHTSWGIGCVKTTLACVAERELMRVCQGGCSVPIGVRTTWTDVVEEEQEQEEQLELHASITALDGTRRVEHRQTAFVRTLAHAERLGRDVARALIAHGGDEILASVVRSKDERKELPGEPAAWQV